MCSYWVFFGEEIEKKYNASRQFTEIRNTMLWLEIYNVH